jgi:hypothetical protein
VAVSDWTKAVGRRDRHAALRAARDDGIGVSGEAARVAGRDAARAMTRSGCARGAGIATTAHRRHCEPAAGRRGSLGPGEGCRVPRSPRPPIGVTASRPQAGVAVSDRTKAVGRRDRHAALRAARDDGIGVSGETARAADHDAARAMTRSGCARGAGIATTAHRRHCEPAAGRRGSLGPGEGCRVPRSPRPPTSVTASRPQAGVAVSDRTKAVGRRDRHAALRAARDDEIGVSGETARAAGRDAALAMTRSGCARGAGNATTAHRRHCEPAAGRRGSLGLDKGCRVPRSPRGPSGRSR